MDTYVATKMPVGPVLKPSHTFRTVFLLLLLATLISAGATTYVLIKQKNTPATTPAPISAADNPFAAETTPTNPFADSANAATVTTPFSDETGENPFDQFETTPSASPTSEYQNPF